MGSAVAWSCSTKQQLLDFHRGVYDGTIFETYALFFKAPPKNLILSDSLAGEVGPFFEWLAQRRWGGISEYLAGLGKAIVFGNAAPWDLIGKYLREATQGNREKLEAARSYIRDDELLGAVLAIFDHGYVFSRVQSQPYGVTFYRDDGRF
jgi:hypothetical protein